MLLRDSAGADALSVSNTASILGQMISESVVYGSETLLDRRYPLQSTLASTTL